MFILTDYLGPSNASPMKSLSSSSSSSVTSSDSDSSVTAGSFSSITLSLSSSTSNVADETSSAKPLSRNESEITSFKLVGDNIDKHVKPREMRESQSLHYFNSYAVKSRLPHANKSETASLPDFKTFQETKILPSDEDTKAIRENFEVLIGRVLKKHCSFFSKFATGVPRHVKHEHYEEMCKKSEIVSHLIAIASY